MATCIQTQAGYAVLQEGQTSCALYVVDADTWARLQSVVSQSVDLDYLQMGAVWAFFFTFTLGLYLLSQSAQTIVNVIKKS